MFTERTKNILFLVALGAVFWFIVSVIDHGALPEGWSWGQTVAGEYEVNRDWMVFKTGKASAHIACKVAEPVGFADLRQEFLPFRFLGSRVRVGAYVKTAISHGSAYLWVQVCGPQGRGQSSDNISDRRITRTTDWTKYELVVDVPKDARTIAFGLVLSGNGDAWVDDFSLQVVGKDVSVTGTDWKQGPVNLGFE